MLQNVVIIVILNNYGRIFYCLNLFACNKRRSYVRMSSKLPKAALSLKQFLLRQEVLKLYREIFRTLKYVQDEKTKIELKEWARADFRNNKHHKDETTIKAMLHYGKKSLKDLQSSMALSKS